MWSEFKKFALKGNVVDLAVGVIIGAAFGKIVSSLVADIMMPLLSILTGGISFSKLSFPVGKEAVKYGMFIQTVVDFLIISFSIFLFIKLFNILKKTEEKEAPKPSREEELLTEIRDLLKQNATNENH